MPRKFAPQTGLRYGFCGGTKMARNKIVDETADFNVPVLESAPGLAPQLPVVPVAPLVVTPVVVAAPVAPLVEPAVLPVPVPQVSAQKYRVGADTRVITNGFVTRLKAGKIVDSRSHDIEALRRQNVPLTVV
jgi:hypothetical protein